MNCQEFENIINGLARDRIMEATQRARALAHAEGCARCAARLRDERNLSGGLRTLAACAEKLEAPARVEAQLLAAFRNLEREMPGTTAITATAPTAPAAASVVARRRWRWATAGIAATLLLLFVAFAATRLQPQQRLQPGQLASAHDPQPLKVASDPAAQAGQVVRHTPDTATTTSGRGALSSQIMYQRMSGRTRHVPVMGGSGSSNRTEALSATAQNALTSNALASASTGGDIATDFIPLTYGASLGGTDSGHVVRVELPSTAMAQFGLPVNAERTGERVKADVLLGEDGLARAIRFVR